MSAFISFKNAVPRIQGVDFAPINWQIDMGEIWAVAGSNGSGKSLLAETLAGQHLLKEGNVVYDFLQESENEHAWESIQLVSFNSTYSIVDFRQMYYQQRFNSTEAGDSPFVRDLLQSDNAGLSVNHEIIEVLNIAKLMDRKLIQLSSGELRKLLIAKVMTKRLRMLIFDNPFIGLDAASRDQLNELFLSMSRQGLQLLFLIPSVNDLPACTEKVLVLDACAVVEEVSAGAFREKYQQVIDCTPIQVDWSQFGSVDGEDVPYKEVVKMTNVEISYGQQIIRQGVNWTIQRGEKWALLGPNGSGKSTLLSYIFADNPQAYAKQLALFDRPRGSGESIWEIKERIGFTSSEMHLYYRENVSALSVVASGFFDSIGLFRKCTELQLAQAHYLLTLLECSHLKEVSFLKLSSGEQRLVLFARSLVKNPELLILDEPFHGLDATKKRLCRQLVESFCSQSDKALIYVTHRREEIPTCINRYMQLN